MNMRKKVENKYYRDTFTNERILNHEIGLTGFDIMFTNKSQWTTRNEAEEYLCGLERYINENGVEVDIDCGTDYILGNIAGYTLLVDDDYIKEFNKLYKTFKKDHKKILKLFKNENKEMI